MSNENATAILEELRLLRGEIDSLRADIAARSTVSVPRVEPYTVSEFAGLIRRHPEYVSDRCRGGLIRSLPGKPYRIPVTELAKWTGVK